MRGHPQMPPSVSKQQVSEPPPSEVLQERVCGHLSRNQRESASTGKSSAIADGAYINPCSPRAHKSHMRSVQPFLPESGFWSSHWIHLVLTLADDGSRRPEQRESQYGSSSARGVAQRQHSADCSVRAL